MKIVEVNGGYAVAYESHEEAQAHLDSLPVPAPTPEPGHGSLHERFDHLVAHLKHRGIHVDGPVPEAAGEVSVPSPSTSAETIVPVANPVPYAPLPVAKKVVEGVDEPSAPAREGV